MQMTACDANRLGIAVLAAAGVPEPAAVVQTDLLVEAELRGHASHGLLRIPRLVERIENGVLDPTTTGSGRWMAHALRIVDGEHGLGPVVALDAITEITKRARTTGLACAAIRSNNHLGMLAWYVEKIARDGRIGIAMTTSEALVHPWGGREALVGSNPIAVGVPALPEPFVFDMATSAVSMGKIIDHANRGAALEPGWAVDIEGTPTTDAAAARAGAIAPFGGPKGYGLGIAVELIVAALTGSALGRDVLGTLDSTNLSTKGDVFIVIDRPDAGTAAAISSYLDTVRASARQRNDVPVRVAGDRARERRDRSTTEGIRIPDELYETLINLARGAGDAVAGRDGRVVSAERRVQSER